MGRMDDLLRKSGRNLGHQAPSSEDGPQKPPRPRPEQQAPIDTPPGQATHPRQGREVQADAIYNPVDIDEPLDLFDDLVFAEEPEPEHSDRPAEPSSQPRSAPADFAASDDGTADRDEDADDDEMTIVDTPPMREPLSDEDKQRLVSLFAPASPQGKRIDMLRSQLLYPFHGDPPRTIMVSSAAPREGRTLLTTNLAISFARGLQQFVMIIDCHLANPEIHRLLQVPLRPGLTDYLEHGYTVPEIIHWTSVDKLSVIPAGRPTHRTAEILATDRMMDLMYELRERYADRYIILDTPPVQAVDDPAVLARVVEGIVFVALGGETDREIALRAMRSLPEEKIIGMVLNDPHQAVLDAPDLGGGIEELG